jgi:preprotein translocase subunit SecD
MQKNLRWKLLVILGVVVLSVWGFYPLDEKVNLGLDLRGGVHLVLRVNTDDALRVETETTTERLRESLDTAGVVVGAVAVTSPTAFEATAIQNDASFLQYAVDVENTFARTTIDGGYRYEMRGPLVNQYRDEAVEQAIQTIERRVNELGVAEPIVARHGVAGQVLVQLPGVDDVERAKEIILSTALLELKMVQYGPFADRETAIQTLGGQIPPDMEIVAGADNLGIAGGGELFYVVRQVAAVTGRDLRTARSSLDLNNLPAVSFTLTQDGAQRFGQVTQENIGRQLAIILDTQVVSAPTIESRITTDGQITGAFTQQEVNDLSLTLRSGALPASMDYLEERTVGPSLGADSIRAGVTASLLGLAFVVVFMLVYYRLTGVNAVISVVMNLMILLALMAYLGATMTLPGIAGFVLTIGIGVDSNVLIFERIKEELATAKSVRGAVSAGFDRVWWTIVDTHVASLISAAFLFQFGTGPIRGFATTLTIGLIANVFTAVFVSRTVFEVILSRRRTVQALSI